MPEMLRLQISAALKNKINTIGIIGCGWLGFPLAKSFIAAGFNVRGSATSSEKLPLLTQAGIESFLLKFPDQISDLSQLLKVDALIINIPPGRRNPTVEVDYPSWISLILKKMASNTKLIFVSSTSVYGANEGLVNEQSKPAPNTASGRALLTIEQFINDSPAIRKACCILRLSGLVGGERHPSRNLAGRTNLSNGDAPVNLVHRQDVINVILQIIQQEKFGTDYNLCSELHPSKKEYYTTMASKLGLAIPQYNGGGANSKIVDSAKIKKELNYEFVYTSPYDFPI